MRFFLDQNVNHRVLKMLGGQGHEAWTADDAMLGGEADNVLAIYAQEQGAVLVTHDKEFSTWRRRQIAGQHLYLTCKERVAHDVLAAHLDDVLPVLDRYPDLFVTVGQDSFKVMHASQSWQAD